MKKFKIKKTLIGILIIGIICLSGSQAASAFGGNTGITSNWFKLVGTTLRMINNSWTLHIENLIADVVTISSYAVGQFTVSTTTPDIDIAFYGDTNTGFNWEANDEIGIYTGGNKVVTIASSSNVGIGDSNPVRDLVVQSSAPVISIRQSDSAGSNLILFGDSASDSSGQIVYSHGANDYMQFKVANTDMLRITSTGNIGIGTTSPANKLEVLGNVYFDGNLTVSGDISGESFYGEMYLDNNATTTVIETANTPIMVNHFTGGSINGFTFTSGSTGAITAYGDYSGVVAGTVIATSTTHGLTTGDHISIRGTTNYNGILEVTVLDANEFYFTDTYVADDGASDWDEGSYLTVGANSAGNYAMVFSGSCSETGGAGSNVLGRAYINATACDKCVGKRKYANNDYGNLPGTAILTLSAGDRIYFTMESSGTNTITCQYGNFNIHKE